MPRSARRMISCRLDGAIGDLEQHALAGGVHVEPAVDYLAEQVVGTEKIAESLARLHLATCTSSRDVPSALSEAAQP